MIYTISSNSFFEQIRNSLQFAGINPAIINFLYYFTVFLILFLIVLLVINYFLRKKEEQNNVIEFGKIKDKDSIKHVLDFALRQRSRFDLKLEKSSQIIYTTFVDYDDKLQFLYIELPLYVKMKKSFLGRKLSCFFRIGDNLNPIFYNFQSVIEGYDFDDKGFCILRIKFPEVVFLGQKRRFLRIEIPSKYLKVVQVWPSVLDKFAGFSKNVLTWGEPLAKYDEENKELLLKDISGGGIKLGIKKDKIKNLSKFKKENEYVFLYIEFEDKSLSPAFFYFICRLKNVYFTDESELDFYFFGFQFVAEGKLDKKGEIEWNDIALDQGCERLENWLFAKYLELYREKKV
ncbi:MAG: hypothetical protein Q9M37_00180 [Desulfonauticus sp.]|nr:hypothetical protein [Desulfonauticus sp.]